MLAAVTVACVHVACVQPRMSRVHVAHGRDSWGFACPPTAQPILRFFGPMGPKGGTDQKLAVLLGGKHGFGPSQVY